jgi:predicted RNA-binding Zn-ribbon protein involved in translation (DUF1610 family)
LRAPLDEKVVVRGKRRPPPDGAVDLHCPSCRKFLGQGVDYVRVICPNCACEVEYRSKRVRQFNDAV